MKKRLLIIFLLAHQLVYCQTKTFIVPGSDYVKLIYSTLYFFENHNDSLRETSYSIYGDTLKRMRDTKVVKKIDDYGQFPPLKVSELDASFNLVNDLNGKVYLLNQIDTKDCYFLKDDSTLVRKKLQKKHVWQQVEYGEYKVYKIDLENNRMIFWANGLGIIYKKDGVLKTNFLPLEYYYQYGSANDLVIKEKDSISMEVDYFDFGIYRVSLKRNETMNALGYWGKYTVTKENKIILDDLSLKYYNDNTLMAYGNGSLKFYNASVGLDSQFYYKTMNRGSDELEFLINNKIKHVSIRDFITTLPDFDRNFACGNVTNYTLKIGKTITEVINGEMSGGSTYTKSIIVQSPIENDSMLFINHQKEMKWSDNGGFYNKMLVFKKGKVGLYAFDLQDSLMVFKQILPVQFDKIYLLNDFVILNKNGTEDFFTYYMKNKKMRFKEISYHQSTYLRYKKINDKEGWVNTEGVLFDDEGRLRVLSNL